MSRLSFDCAITMSCLSGDKIRNVILALYQFKQFKKYSPISSFNENFFYLLLQPCFLMQKYCFSTSNAKDFV